PAGARGVSGELRKLSQANVAQAAISTQRYLKGLSPAFCRITLKLTAIDYTEPLTIIELGSAEPYPSGERRVNVTFATPGSLSNALVLGPLGLSARVRAVLRLKLPPP